MIKIKIKKNILKENKIELKIIKYHKYNLKKVMVQWIQVDLIKINLMDHKKNQLVVKVEVVKIMH